MDDFDDYFTDDIVFDEQTLAVLDKEERKYLTQNKDITQAPPAKKLKTDSGWRAIAATSKFADDLPEINLQVDGSYGVQDNSIHRPAQTSRTFAPRTHNTVYHQSRASYPLSRSSSPVNVTYKTPTSDHANTTPHRSVSDPKAIRREQRSKDGPLNKVAPSPLVNKMSELQIMLEELRKENAQIQVALKEATDAKLTKEGEVSILRKNIEKFSQKHSEEVARLKASKEEADAKQIQMQRELKDEMERLKTQFTFKQHELELSHRKPPPSIRSKKAFKEPPSTPMTIPSQMRGWNQNITPRVQDRTPLGPRRRVQPLALSPKKQHRYSPEKSKMNSALPGFQNSFVDLPSIPPSSSQSNKHEEVTGGISDSPRVSLSDVLSSPISQRFNDHSDQQPLLEPAKIERGNTIIEDIETVLEDQDSEDFENIKHIDWKFEMSNIILTHSFPSGGPGTFQLLLGFTNVLSLQDPRLVEYSTACSLLIEAIATTIKPQDYNEVVRTVASSFLMMGTILVMSEFLPTLTSLLDLLAVMVNSLPDFGVSLLNGVSIEDNGDSSMTTLLSKLIQSYITPGVVRNDPLIGAICSLLESLCFKGSDESLKNLSRITNQTDTLSNILHSSQPSWILERAGCFLVLLVSHPFIFRVFLDLPEVALKRDPNQNSVKLPLIDKLCSFLIDFTRNENEFQTFKLYILTFFALLSTSNPDAHSTLVGSYILIPSLVFFLTQLTTPLWEDAAPIISDSASLIRTLNQTLFLLHHLVTGSGQALNLRHKLHHAPHRPFNGLTHMFIVTFGRLSYADPPEWLNKTSRLELELLSDMARELLDLVVDGPEGDSVWAAYQAGADQDSLTDEDEMEARLIG